MASLKDIKIRIDSVRSTQQLTSAMKMVSASKLRRAQLAQNTLKDVADKLGQIVRNIYAGFENNKLQFFFKDRDKISHALIVVITSDKGLCGSFNGTVIKAAVNLIETEYKELALKNKVEVLCLGKKGLEFFSKKPYKIHPLSNTPLDHLTYKLIFPIAQAVVRAYTKGVYDRVEFIYHRPINAATQQLHIQRFLPLTKVAEVGEVQNNELVIDQLPPDAIFLPNKEDVIVQLVPGLFKVYFYYMLLEAATAEHGARMTAMHKASDNAMQLLKVLNMDYNKKRQSAITNELMEIVSGAEALNNQ
ncbi:MAG: ATP synthase F1 subunit gamma [Bacteroidales bacterium]